MRIMVTGSSGMIGSVLCARLLDDGHRVLPVDREPNHWDARVDGMTQRIDLLDDLAVRALTTDVDWVVHLAANARVLDLVVDPTGARENMVTAFNVIEHARRSSAFCVFASSREVYGNQGRHVYAEGDVDLDHIESPYAASKLSAEVLLRSYGRAYGLKHAIVRFSNVYGRNDTSDRFVPIVFRRLALGQPITIYGEQKSLDFTYIDDAIEGLLRLIDRPEVANGQTFNLSRGARATLVEVAEMIARLVARPLELRMEDTRPGEVIHFEGDIHRAHELLGFAPKVDVREGLARAAEWYRDHALDNVDPLVINAAV